MNAISWNCRGLGNSRAVRALRDVVKSYNPSIVFLMETLSIKERIEKLRGKLGYDNQWVVDSIGRGGGLALIWKNSVKCTVIGSGNNFIDVSITNANGSEWRMTGFYGFPERARRKASWDLLKQLSGKSDLPWIVMGDFNDMINIEDRKGPHDHPQALLDGFKQTIESCGLIELDLMGGSFTWEKSRGTRDWVRGRIYRAFASGDWWNLFPLCKLTVHHCVYSDHDPIQLDMYNTEHAKKKFRFRFENVWLREQKFHEEVAAYWKHLKPSHFLPKLLELSSFINKWGRRFFNKFRQKIIE
ncbi:uncharacterized protein LOC141702378 [Apium graveolens]|uniref:uncharacterized protein LOC141702378 n=1 Tax=Apium graveolens TaxID=4045 RepID=UPI003D79215B